MFRAYDDVVASRRARLGSEAVAQGEVFAEAYRSAMQVTDSREKHGLIQAQLTQRCGMSQADISRIERGSTNPTQSENASTAANRRRSRRRGASHRRQFFLRRP